MKLGLLTAPFPETPLDEVADWTAGAGFTTIEIAIPVSPYQVELFR